MAIVKRMRAWVRTRLRLSATGENLDVSGGLVMD